MVERRPWLDFLAHAVLLAGVALVAFPLYVTFVASTQTAQEVAAAPMSLAPGSHFIDNYVTALISGSSTGANTAPVGRMMWISLVMALSIALGKIAISLLSAFAVVYFRFPGRMFFFWMIFVTLMLPVEVRMVPTYEVISDLGWIDSYTGLIIPLIASATATFLLRQFFMTVPKELAEAAQLDGASPLRFLWSILLPLSWQNLAALFVVHFVYGWKQYLWPLMMTTSRNMQVVVIGIQRLIPSGTQLPEWHLVMAAAIMALLPPVVVIIVMQRYFVKALMDSEK